MAKRSSNKAKYSKMIFITIIVFAITVSIVTAVFVSISNVSMVENLLVRETRGIQRQINNTINVMLDYIDKGLLQYSINKSVDKLIGKNVETIEDYQDFKNLIEIGNNYSMSHSMIENFELFFPDTGFCISNSTYTLEQLKEYKGINIDFYMDLMDKAYEYKIVGREIQSAGIAFDLPVISVIRYFKKGTSGFYAIANINKKDMIFQLGNIMNAYKDMSLYVFFDKEIIQTGVNEIPKELLVSLNNKNDYEMMSIVKVEGKKHYVSKFKTDSKNVSIMLFNPRSTLMHEAIGTSANLIWVLPVVILLMIFLSSIISIKIYTPIGNLLKSMNIDNKTQDTEFDELSHIQTKFDEILKRSKESDLQLKSYIPIIRKNIISSVINGNIDDISENKRLQQYGISFTKEKFAVILVDVEREEELTNSEATVLVEMCISNYLDDAQNIDYYISEGNGKLCILLNFDDLDLNAHNPFYVFCERICLNIKEVLGFTTTFACGKIVCDLSEVPASYNTAQESLTKKYIYGKGEIILYDDLAEISEGDPYSYYPTELENRIINSVSDNDYEMVVKYLSALIAQVQSRPYLNQNHIRVIGARLAMGVVKVIGVHDSDNMYLAEDVYECLLLGFSDTITFDEYLERLKNFYKNLINNRLEKRKCKNNELVKKIKGYIDDNLKNNISVEDISAYLGASSAHIGRIFKVEEGDTVQNYLLNKKMEYAKELLETTDKKISEISSIVGYYSVAGFNRTFKMYFGFPPNHFRADLEN